MAAFSPRRVLACAAALLLSACSDSELPPLKDPPGKRVGSSADRVLKPQATAVEDMATVVADNTDLGAELLRLSAPGTNVFFSPYSITQALGMVYAGARGETEAQMARALRFSLPQERLHPARNALDLALQPRANKDRSGKPLPAFRVVSATWGQKGLAFEPAFLDVLARDYGAAMWTVDFAQEPEAIRADINEWVEDQTAGRIRDLVKSGGVTPATRLMLVNALYFKGAWVEPFKEGATRDVPFHLLSGESKPVPMMAGGQGQYMAGEGFEAVALAYRGEEFRMLVVLPAAGRFAEVEGRLSSGLLDDVHARLKARSLSIALPRFQMESEFPLGNALRSLGMEAAFSEQADFSGLTRRAALSLGPVSHKAFVAVDEEGTEAAAATAVGVVLTSAPEPFVVDRPFLFFIEHTATKNVLFLGRYVSP